MSAAIDGELTQEEKTALQAHLDRCEDCRRIYAAMTSIDEEVAALSQPAPEGLKQGILYRIGQESGKTKAPRRRFFGVGTGCGLVAAVLVLLVGTGVVRLPQMGQKSASSADASVNESADRDTAELCATNGEAWFGEAPEDSLQSNGIRSEGAGPNQDKSVPIVNSGSLSGASESGVSSDAQPGELPVDFRLDKRPVDTPSRVACQTLCTETGMPLLLYSEFTDESLFSLLEEAEPELYFEIAAFLPEESPAPDPDTGLIVYEMDYKTVLAVQEWLVSGLVSGAEKEQPSASRLREMMEELDPGSDCLYRVITWTAAGENVSWPEIWPEGWENRFLSRDNWALFLPKEDAALRKDAPACLVFRAVNP